MYNFPDTPSNGQIVTSFSGASYQWDGSKWMPRSGGSAVVSDTPPSSPAIGTLWWDSAGGQMYVWYADADSSQWVVANGTGGGGGSTGVTSWNTRTGVVTLSITDVTSVGGAPLASPAFTGSPTAPTQGAGDNSTKLATTAYVASYLPLAGGTLSGNLTISNSGPQLALNSAAAGQGHTLMALTASKARWAIQPGDGATETGGNAGTNFAIYRYDDAGNYLGNPLSISRSNGLATFTNQVSVYNLIVNSVGNGQFQLFTNNGDDPTVNFDSGTYVQKIHNGPDLAVVAGNGGAVRCMVSGGGYYTKLDTSNNFSITGQGWKPGGGSWADNSDARVKTVLGDYEHGLKQVIALQPVRYKYKGNVVHLSKQQRDVRGEDAEPEQPAHAAVLDREFIGLVAQDAEKSMPELVTLTEGLIDGKPHDDIRVLDATALTYALVNAVKELTQRIVALEAARK